MWLLEFLSANDDLKPDDQIEDLVWNLRDNFLKSGFETISVKMAGLKQPLVSQIYRNRLNRTWNFQYRILRWFPNFCPHWNSGKKPWFQGIAYIIIWINPYNYLDPLSM